MVEYLDLLGVEPGDVRVLIASHAHDDHITDFATLVETYPDAVVACSTATTSEEFFALLEQDVHFLELRHAVYREFNRIFDLMRERRTDRQGTPTRGRSKHANSGDVLGRRRSPLRVSGHCPRLTSP